MKHITTLLLGLAVAASAQALPYKKADLSAFLSAEPKQLHQTTLKSGAQSRSEDEEWTVPEPIYDLPEGGEAKIYRRSSEMIYYTWDGLVMAEDDFFAGEVVFYDNGDVYMRNMIPSMISGSYLKGYREGNTITLDFPQGLCYDDPYYDDETGKWVTDAIWPVFRAGYEISQEWDDEWEEYVGTIEVWVDPDDQTISFTINEDGSITQDDASAMLGVFTRGELWYGESAWDYKYAPFDEPLAEMPAGIEPQEWAFSTETTAYLTKMAFDGDDVYWQGLYQGLPSAVIKGKVDGDKVNFESPIYIGPDPVTGHLAYAAGTYVKSNMLHFADAAAFDYDAEAGRMAYPKQYLIVNAGNEQMNLIAQYYSPTLSLQRESPEYAAPLTPEFKWVTEWEYDDFLDTYCWWCVVNIPNVDVNGNLLDVDRMWYNFYFDGELFWFDVEDYQLVQDSPDVPYTYDDNWTIFYRGTEHYVYFFWTGYQSMAVQSVFEDEDGNVYRSDKAYYGDDGVQSAIEEQEPVEVNYFDLHGRRLIAPQGLCIKQAIYPDGTVKTTKAIIK